VNNILARAKTINIHVWAYATVPVAFFLRVYRLADKNIWWDEGWSIWLSQKDLAWIALRTAADEHPPLYYWKLHFWDVLAGTDAFAGRFISLAFGVLTIALLYRIGKRVGGAWIGVLAALFLAVARFHIWWSQDIKNYTPSIFFAFAALWFALDVIASPEGAKQAPLSKEGIASSHPSLRSGSPLAMTTWKSIIGYALCAALALWTHYLAALVLLAVNVYATFVFARTFYVSRSTPHTPRPTPQLTVRHWFIANLLAAALFAPWMILYLQYAAAWIAAPVFDFALFLKLVATVLPLGVTTNIENYAALTIALTTLAALGCASVIARSVATKQSHLSNSFPLARGGPGWSQGLLFALIVLLPPLLIYLLSLTPVAFFAPKIQARYLLVLLPAYVMLLALGISLLREFSVYLALTATVFVWGTSAFVLNDYYAERRLRDEYTTLANTINSFVRQGDLVLLDTDQEWPTFLYYLRAPLDWLGVPNGVPMNTANADTLAQRALTRHDAVWLVAIPDALATDPQRLLETRLARELPKQFEQTFGDKRLAFFAAAPRDLINVPRENFIVQHPRAAKVNDNLQLLGFDLPVREARAGDTLRVVTYWQAVTVGAVEINLHTRQLARAVGVQVPAGERVRVETDFVIPPNAEGDLSVTAGTVELARVRVEPRAGIAPAGAITNRVDYRLGDAIHFVGYDLATTRFRAGESVPITLYWRADRAVEKNYVAFVHLRGDQFNPKQNNPLWGQADRVPREGAYPTTAWLPNEIVPDVYRVPIDARAPAGRYKIEIGLYDAGTGARLAVDGGQDSISIGEIEITLP
jgi:hypothetical protein